MLQSIDVGILQFLNSFATKSAAFDILYTRGFQMHSAKFLPMIICMVWLWSNADELSKRRFLLLQAGLGAVIAPFISRLIQSSSPPRPRPIHTEGLDFVLPVEVTADQLQEWSSFPSDNAALGFALAMGIWRVSRPLGWACFIWATFVVGLPRVYAGYHFPSDILGGALLGILSMVAFGKLTANLGILHRLASLQRQSPGLFYSACFAALFWITTQFEDLRKAGDRFADLL